MEQVEVWLGSQVRKVAREAALTAGDELMAAFPALAREYGRPSFRVVTEEAQAGSAERTANGRPMPWQPGGVPGADLEDVAPGAWDAVGAARSAIDRQAAEAAGFAPAQPLYRAGTRVIDLGQQNFRASRMEFEQRPLVGAACEDFVRRVDAEQRAHLEVEPGALRMTARGLVRGPRGDLFVTRRAFSALCTELGIGVGARYLAECCDDVLRAKNFNAQAVRFAAQQEEFAAEKRARAVLRTRRAATGDGTREVFAVVSPRYAAYDVDLVASAIAAAAPEDGRARIDYDGARARFVVGWHSNVQPEHAVAGEFFRASVIVTTDDTGGGSLKLSAAIEQNLCLNLIIVDFAEIETARIRHIGSFDRLAAEFREGFAAAVGKTAHFRKAWGYAVEQDALKLLPDSAREELAGLPVSLALPGLFNGLVEHELLPVRGERKAAVRGLLAAYESDRSAAVVGRPTGTLSLAAVVNAATRYAHTAGLSVDDEDAIERAAGKLLGKQRGGEVVPLAQLPYEPIDLG